MPKKRIYEIAIIIAGTVSGILERDKRIFLPVKRRFAQKKARNSPTSIANKEEKKEWVKVKIKIEIKDELPALSFFKIEISCEKRGLKEANRGKRKKAKHAIKEKNPKDRIILCI